MRVNALLDDFWAGRLAAVAFFTSTMTDGRTFEFIELFRK